MSGELEPGSLIAKLGQELAKVERADWELWLIVAGAGIIVGVGLLAVIFPSALLKQGNVHFEIEVSRELFIGLVALLILFNTYIISRRLELRRTRQAIISTTIQGELMRLQSFVDPLTEVYNRRSLDAMAANYMKRAKRQGKPLSFMLIDLDRFKEVNSRFGHLTGDMVIAEIAGLLTAVVRGADAVIRYGGDEFLIILADAPLEGAKVVAGRVTKSLEEWNRAGHLPDYEMGLSIGLAQWFADRNLDEVMNEADRKMYSAKRFRQAADRSDSAFRDESPG
jgi:diguanylate cyclase (GGDEF)-like protein